jgi:hypothetical protein
MVCAPVIADLSFVSPVPSFAWITRCLRGSLRSDSTEPGEVYDRRSLR